LYNIFFVKQQALQPAGRSRFPQKWADAVATATRWNKNFRKRFRLETGPIGGRLFDFEVPQLPKIYTNFDFFFYLNF
jgi:hypothetical protein